MPQSWNKFRYSGNSPLKFNDSTGLFEWDASLQDDASLSKKERKNRSSKRRNILKGIDLAREKIEKNKGRLSAVDYQKINNALNSLGPKPGEAGADNGVTIGIGVVANGVASATPDFTYLQSQSSSADKVDVKVSILFSPDFVDKKGLFMGIIHEASHVADAQEFASDPASLYSPSNPLNRSQYQTESRAFELNQALLVAMNENGSDYDIPVWNKDWAKLDKATVNVGKQNAVDAMVENYKDSYGMPITPRNQGGNFSDYGISVQHVR